MSATPSNMMPLGTIAPDFSLLDTISGKYKSLADLKGEKGTLVMFICNHCPYVIHIKDNVSNEYARPPRHALCYATYDGLLSWRFSRLYYRVTRHSC
jgi:hypothetical protein